MTDLINNGMTVEQVLVTPALAGEWLTRNPHNRNESPQRIRRYARDMEEGRWMLTHQPIAFDEDGNVLDGQNRLQAVLRSNTATPFLVVHGAPKESFFVVDTGKPRNLSDALTIQGEVNARIIAAATNLLWRITEGMENGTPAAGNPSTVRALQFFDARKQGMRDAIKPAGHVYYYLKGPHSAYGGLYHRFATIDHDDADVFYDRLAVGAHLNEKDGILVLRNHILNVTRTEGKSLALDRIYVAAIMVKAWNAYREGRDVRTLTWKRGGANPESFPTPV